MTTEADKLAWKALGVLIGYSFLCGLIGGGIYAAITGA